MIRSRRRKVVVGRVAQAPVAETRRSTRAAGLEIHVGQLVGWDDQGPIVDYPGNQRGHLRARVTSATPGAQPVKRPTGAGAATPLTGREVVLLVDPRPGRAPVMLGYLTPITPSLADDDVEARVDGRRVELEGRDEIVLRCGEASITLRRNGRISIRGVDVETRAAGSNRIRGGTVDIN